VSDLNDGIHCPGLGAFAERPPSRRRRRRQQVGCAAQPAEIAGTHQYSRCGEEWVGSHPQIIIYMSKEATRENGNSYGFDLDALLSYNPLKEVLLDLLRRVNEQGARLDNTPGCPK